jgi:hypothetical protein
MPISPELAELYNERDFLRGQLDEVAPLTPYYDELWHRIDRINVAIQIRRETSAWRKEAVYVIASSQKEAKSLARVSGLRHASYAMARDVLSWLKKDVSPESDVEYFQIVSRYKVWRVEIRRPLTKKEIEAKYLLNETL